MDLFFNRIWYGKKGIMWLLLMPLSFIYGIIVGIKYLCYRFNICKTTKLQVPVIIVGNFTVGGGGKTPMIAALVGFFQDQGYKPGVICKGYKGELTHSPILITDKLSPSAVGDEACLLHQQLDVPIVACKNRVLAAQYLIEHTDCNLILSDDGLSHLALGRDLEIIMVNDKLGFGNGSLLPAGPLRQMPVFHKPNRLMVYSKTVRHIKDRAEESDKPVIYRYPEKLVKLDTGEAISLQQLQGQEVDAITGIAYPEGFFQLLESLGAKVNRFPMPDHHAFQQKDFPDKRFSNWCVLTEKDAVKCRQFDLNNLYVLHLSVCLNNQLHQFLVSKINSLLAN